MNRTRRLLSLSWILLPLLPSACGGAREPGSRAPDYPRQTLNVMAPAAPGGGWDQTARAMQAALAASTGQQAQVYNVAGAGGAVGLAHFIGDHAGDPHQLLVGGLVMVGATAANQSPVTLDQVTPIAALTAEWEAIVVPANSPYQSFQQLLDAFEAQPASVAWGGGSAGGVDHILVGLVARAAGVAPVQINYIAHSGGGEALAALLSGAVTAGVAGVSELRDQVQAGKLRWLAVASDRPLAGVNAPPLKDEGLDVVLPNWRAVFAPPGISNEQCLAIIETMKKMRATPQWQQALEQNGWNDFFKTGDEFAGFLQEEQTRIKETLRAMGWTPDSGSAISPRFFPLLVVTGLLVLGVIFALRITVFPDRGLLRQAAAEAAVTHWPTVGMMAAALLGYVLALGWLGYIVATALFFPTVARLLGSPWLARDALIGFALSVAIYYDFTRLLGIRLPAGLLALQ